MLQRAAAAAAHDLSAGAGLGDVAEGVGARIPETLGVRGGADAEGIEDCYDRSHATPDAIAMWLSSPVYGGGAE